MVVFCQFDFLKLVVRSILAVFESWKTVEYRQLTAASLQIFIHILMRLKNFCRSPVGGPRRHIGGFDKTTLCYRICITNSPNYKADSGASLIFQNPKLMFAHIIRALRV